MIASAMLLYGCTFDFSQFPTEQTESPDGGFDMPDALVLDFDMDVVDMSSNDDMGDVDANNTGLEVGTPCADDSECTDGICRLGFCTLGCATTDECPEGTFCGSPTSESICIASCEVQACAASFACADVSAVDSLSAPGCLPDGDSDGAVDFSDNCPDEANPEQADVDGDGQGDACDAEPLCSDGHVDGIFEVASVAYAAENPATPSYVNDWFPVAGGLGAQGESTSVLSVFDRAAASTTDSMVPYRATDFGMVQVAPNEFLMTPGDLGESLQFGRFLHVFRDGTVRRGIPFEPAVTAPTLAAMASEIWMHAYPGSGNGYRFYRYSPDGNRFVGFDQGNDGVRTRWHSGQRPGGDIFFYSTVYDQLNRLGRLSTVQPATGVSTTAIQYPDLGDGVAFEPFFVPAAGGGYFVWDRRTGRAFTYDGATFAEATELAVTVDLVDADWLSQPSGLGFVLVGRDAADETMLKAVSYSLACLAGVDAFDRDADGTNDIVDLCPADPDSATGDLDGDRIGDACDSDADGDGIDDAADPSLMDTDNDMMTNDVDDDDDADGIPDVADTLPLDTDNDGQPNAIDRDDDDDGYFDVQDSDILDPLDFPGAGRLLWRSGSDVVYASLGGTDNPTTLPRVGAGEPTSPRFSPDGDYIALVDGVAGQTSQLEFVDLAGNGSTYDIGVGAYGVDVIASAAGALNEVAVTHAEQTDPNKVVLSRLDLTTANFAQLVSVLEELGEPDYGVDGTAFLAQPRGCVDCRSAYLVGPSGGVPRLIAAEVSNPAGVRYNRGWVTLVGDASDDSGTAVWAGSSDELFEYRPPGVTEVHAAVSGSETTERHLFVVATDADGPALWFRNALKNRWYRLADLAEPTDTLDWTR